MTDSKQERFYDAEALLNGNSEHEFPQYKDLVDTNIFITGGGSGIGAYFVTAFALQGANVGFVSLSEGPANTLCDGVEALCGKRPSFYPCDIRDIDALETYLS